MIAPEDRVALAPGVSLREGVLVDSARGVGIAANEAAAMVLKHADGRTIAELGGLLAAQGAREGVRDALTFCAELNKRLLVNVRIRPAARLRRRAAAARFGIVLRAPPRRVRRTRAGLLFVAAVLAAVALPLALLVGAWPLAVGVGIGVLLHEGAHAAALRGVPHALVLHGLRPSLLHPRLGAARAFLVAAAGPLAPALAALATVAAWRAAAPACAPLAAHALGLTVLAPDGRHACGLC